MKLKCLATLAVSALVFGAPVAAQDWTGLFRLSGSVVHEDGEPVEAANVVIHIGTEGRGPKPVITKKNGKWAFLGLKTGVWTVTVTKEGKIPSVGQLQVGSATAPLRIVLRDIPEEELYNQRALEAKKQLDEGNILLGNGDPGGARAKFEEAMGNLPEEHHAAILLAIADSYSSEDDMAGRMESLEKAEAIAPTDASVLMAVARANYDQGDADGAISKLQQVLEVEPDNAMVLQVLVDLMVAEGRVEEAQPFIDRMPEGAKLDPNALLNVGIDHYNAGEMDEAMVQFDEVVKNYPELPTALYYRGLVYLGRGENALAAADLKKFIEVEPDSPKAAEAKEFLSYLEPEE